MPEPKTRAYWRGRGYVFISRAFCPACHAEVELWQPRKGHMVQVDARTFEAHFSQCSNVREYRAQQQMKAGVL